MDSEEIQQYIADACKMFSQVFWIIKSAPLLLLLQVAEEEYLTLELRKIESRKREREKKAQDLQKLIKAADTTTELRRAEKRVSKKKLPQKRETEKPVRRALKMKQPFVAEKLLPANAT